MQCGSYKLACVGLHQGNYFWGAELSWKLAWCTELQYEWNDVSTSQCWAVLSWLWYIVKQCISNSCFHYRRKTSLHKKFEGTSRSDEQLQEACSGFRSTMFIPKWVRKRRVRNKKLKSTTWRTTITSHIWFREAWANFTFLHPFT